ncbi:MAG: lipid kinase [Methylobacteriaceae bacterium]|nr:lipid kinase [Methylobacteriaceae bacterium]
MASGRPRRALVIVNRKARNGGARIDAALAIFREAGIDVEEVAAPSAAKLGDAIRERAAACDIAVIGGGDGTLNCAAGAIIETGLPLGILPLGTANDLARTLGLPLEPVGAARVIVEGRLRTIDVGDVNGRHFFNVASVGFSAELAQELSADLKRRFGTLGYALASARLLGRMRPFTAFIEHDGEILKVKTVQIAVGNGRHYGGGLTVDADAEPDDGKLHVYSLELDHWWKLIALAPALKRGTVASWRGVRTFTTAAVTIRTRRTRSVNTDGELTSATPATFRVIPAGVRVFAPPPPLTA